MFKHFRYLIMLLIFLPIYSQACVYTYIGSPYTENYGDIIVQRDTPIGSPISSVIYGTMAKTYSCVSSGAEGSTAGIKSGVLQYALTSSGSARIYKTNLPGVGISFGVNLNTSAGSSSWSGSGIIGIPGPINVSPDVWALNWYTYNTNETNTYNYQPRIQFWKIGPITSGMVTGQIASFIANENNSATGAWVREVPIYIGSGSITQVACSISTPNLTFPIGNVLASSFASTIGTVPSGAQNTQNLGLNCDAGANINVMLQGTQNPDVGTTSVLALTGQGNADVAKGVGVQLLYNGTPLTLNNRIVLKQSAGGQETFPITARYYQTKTSVSTGKANAAATLDLTYQ